MYVRVGVGEKKRGGAWIDRQRYKFDLHICLCREPFGRIHTKLNNGYNLEQYGIWEIGSGMGGQAVGKDSNITL